MKMHWSLVSGLSSRLRSLQVENWDVLDWRQQPRRPSRLHVHFRSSESLNPRLALLSQNLFSSRLVGRFKRSFIPFDPDAVSRSVSAGSF